MDTMTTKIRDFVKDAPELYEPGKIPVVIDVPDMQFLMIDGQGMPDPSVGSDQDLGQFRQAMSAIYGLAFAIKMSDRSGTEPRGYEPFKLPPIEALWWVDDANSFDFDSATPHDWRWTLMVRMPEFVTDGLVARLARTLERTKGNPIYRQVRLDHLREGRCVQLMHTGSYDSEGPNIERLHKHALAIGYKLHGKHHEIYFGDPRRSAPEKLRTVLRQPIVK